MRLLLATFAMTVLLLLTASSALAHIVPDPRAVAAGETAAVVFTVEHGCGMSPTTDVALDLPQEVELIEAAEVDGWRLDVSDERVVWSGGELPHDQAGDFTVVMTMPETPGLELFFPMVQSCTDGSYEWTETPREGQTEADLSEPAPVLVLTDGAPTAEDLDDPVDHQHDGHDHDHGDHDGQDDHETTDDATPEHDHEEGEVASTPETTEERVGDQPTSDTTSTGARWLPEALGLGVGLVLVGGGLWLRRNRRTG